ncbi:MAG TPA: CopD family protein, partial [Chondromyces sp.]|nr:CopD family protein [Chondromyces sp.]
MPLIPSNKKPSLYIHKRWLQLSVLGITLFSFMPVGYLAFTLHQNTGLFLSIQDLFFSIEIGKAWIATFVISIFFFLFISFFPVLENKRYSIISILFILFLIFTIGWASHPASTTDWTGFLYHSVHFMAVSVWTGVLFIVSWFSKNQENWLAFLKWFTPVAVVCFGLTALSGFMMMTIIVDPADYVNSWMLDYGQGLLIKHILILPLLFFAFINGFWIKRQLRRGTDYHPIPWVKAESVLLLLIFSATAVLGQQEPPRNIESMVGSSNVSSLFYYIYGETIPALPVQLGVHFMNLSLFGLSILFLILALWSFINKV